MAGNSSEPGRSVTSKVVAILLTFHDGEEHSLTEIARLTGLPVSPTHRPVTTFAHAPRLPAHASALGKALLAFSCAETQNRVIAAGLKRYTPYTLTDPERLRGCLGVIRLTQVAVSRGEFERGVSAVAV